MPYQIQDISEADFPALVNSMWYTYEHPPQGLFYVFAPKNANGCASKEESIEESRQRLWEWHTSDPSSYWTKVVNTEDGEIVGGALWKLNKTNPYETAQDEEAYWHPPGSQREYANQVLEQYEATRSQLARRPHVYLNIIWTHPDHQRRGIGSQLLEWGIAKASEMGVEMWLNAWKYGRQLYEKHGFVTIEHHLTQPQAADPDEAWKRCEKEFTDLEEWVMWRPKDGPFVEVKSVKPWEK